MLSAAEYLRRDGTALAAAIRRGELTASEVLDAAIARIHSLNPALNAVTETCFDQARAAVAVLDRAAPLAGVPFLAKDANIEVAGLALRYSSRWLREAPAAAADSVLAARWRRSGLVTLGRTNTPEWALDWFTEPAWRGITRNPWDAAVSVGGSSGGAAAAVASGMVPIAHATDCGGSIRIPAAATGLFGFKPSRGRTPVGPHQDELMGGLDCEHVISRSVRDSAQVLASTAGPEPSGRYWGTQLEFAPAMLEQAPPPLDVGVIHEGPAGELPDAEVAAAVDDVAEQLGRAGHRIRAARFPPQAAGSAELVDRLMVAALAEEVDALVERCGEPGPDDLEPATWSALESGRRMSARQFLQARRSAARLTGALAAAFSEYDALLLPTTATLPPAAGLRSRPDAAFATWALPGRTYAPFTEIFNVSGQPAASVPAALSRRALPIGVQLVGKAGMDALLLQVCAWLERERPWAHRLAELMRRLPQ